jgi:hypothetical protein
MKAKKMLVKQGQIYRTDNVYTDELTEEKFDCVEITFPTPADGDVYYVIDAAPCTEDGQRARGFEMGVPHLVEDFIELIQDV